jgi:acetylornithine deacetylase/succinyl-diaminopimelate desuccinylase-like protein
VAQPASAQCGHEATVGAVRSGSFEKVDLVAAIFEAAAYVMFPPGEDPEAITADLTDAISAQLNEDVEVEVYASVVGGSSPPDATIVTLANEVWDEAHGTGSHVVSGWTGSTDGAIFRNAGIDTVRIGLSTRPGDDPRTDVVALDDVVVSAEMYAEMAVRFATMDAT